MVEKERLEKALRTHEGDLHTMQLREGELKSQLRDRAGLEKRIEEMKSEIVDSSKRLKVHCMRLLTRCFAITDKPTGLGCKDRSSPETYQEIR